MSNKTKTKDKPFFKSGYDLYSDKNPNDTIRIKYKTLKEVKETIKKLESIYKKNVKPHNRIVQIVNIIKQRLKVIVKNFNKGRDRLELISQYMDFLKDRTKIKNEKERKKLKFTSQLFS